MKEIPIYGCSENYYLGVRLNRAPTADVFIPVACGSMVDHDHLLFTPDNWNVEQRCSTECSDPLVFGPSISNDISFSGVTTEARIKSSSNNEGLRLSKCSVNISSSACYGSTTDSFNVVLSHEPVTEVVFSLRLKDPAAGTLSANELIFTPQNWDIPQTVTVTGTPGAQEISTGVELEIINEAVFSGTSLQGYSAFVEANICSITQFYHIDSGTCVDADKAALTIQEDGSCAPIPPEFVTIPAGTFHSSAENPVSLESFKIARTETTVRQYAGCIAAGACTDNHYYKYSSSDSTHKNCTYGRPGYFSEHPMNCVDWYGANEYCAWIGGRLPTADEWQYAATHDGTQALETIYPWGDEAPTPAYANYGASEAFTTPVGTYSPLGDSPLGLQDMAGNVLEWTSSLSSAESSSYISKGGSWNYGASVLPVSDRISWYPDVGNYYLGFRCVAPSR